MKEWKQGGLQVSLSPNLRALAGQVLLSRQALSWATPARFLDQCKFYQVFLNALSCVSACHPERLAVSLCLSRQRSGCRGSAHLVRLSALLHPPLLDGLLQWRLGREQPALCLKGTHWKGGTEAGAGFPSASQLQPVKGAYGLLQKGNCSTAVSLIMKTLEDWCWDQSRLILVLMTLAQKYKSKPINFLRPKCLETLSIQGGLEAHTARAGLPGGVIETGWNLIAVGKVRSFGTNNKTFCYKLQGCQLEELCREKYICRIWDVCKSSAMKRVNPSGDVTSEEQRKINSHGKSPCESSPPLKHYVQCQPYSRKSSSNQNRPRNRLQNYQYNILRQQD